jgi:hypothetical protein
LPKNRSAFLSYVLVMLTGGIFAFVWAGLMMRDINRLAGRKRIPVVAISTVMAVSFVATLAALAWDDWMDLPPSLAFWVEWFGFISSFVAFGSFALGIVLVYREILGLNGRPFGIGAASLAGLGTLLGYLFLPYAQLQLNRLENRLTASN